jgi:DNA-binding IclR family transcriptional regulator
MAKSSQTSSAEVQRRRPRWAMDAARTAPAAAPANERYHSRTIERALDILEAFQPDLPYLSLKDVSRVTGLPESSAFRILLTLQKRHYLEQRTDGTYQLSRKILFGRLLDSSEALRELAHEKIQDIATSFNETASLAYLFEDYIQVLDTVETFHEIRVTNRRGRILPPHCSAMGKTILAFQPTDVANRMLEAYGLTQRTQYSIVDRQALFAEFSRIRQDGFAFDREESILGGICIAAPIYSGNRRVVAAISVSTPKQRIASQREGEIRQAVVATAGAISKALQTSNR